MTWKDITVEQYQRIVPILDEEQSTELDKLVRMIAAITGKTEQEIDGWALKELNQYRFLFKLDFPNVIPKYIKANGKKYKFVHEIQKMPAARYVESKAFLQDGLIANLHKIMASCVLPMRKTLWGYEVAKYDAGEHERYAEDMKQAPFTEVYNACLFFCLLFANWMKSSQTYLMQDMVQVMTPEEIEVLSQSLTVTLDGLTAQPLSLNTNG